MAKTPAPMSWGIIDSSKQRSNLPSFAWLEIFHINISKPDHHIIILTSLKIFAKVLIPIARCCMTELLEKRSSSSRV
jgi:hypothetical protein